MMVHNNAEEIEKLFEGRPGSYSHYTGKPITPGQHNVKYICQTVGDGYEAWCSCGQWRAFEHWYEYPSAPMLLDVLEAEHRKHVNQQKSE